ncbi:HAD family hydrolase [Streptomyces sp. NPDC018019]|uniref:HAD family hydrolase n=1 Tax=Streptomyces sp. NPDC018019 TaxID=3365030 RepID=UPI0037900678
MIEAVVFDVGETLVSDDRYWHDWADWLDVPWHTLSALVGAVVAQGRDNADAVRLLRPGIDLAAEYEACEAAGRGEYLDETDLYPDVRPALTSLRAAGARVLIAGNQTASAGALLRGLELPADAIATSGEWGVAKPRPEFFDKVIDLAGVAPECILYVGDHPANDIIPAHAAGLRTAHVRRGPYGILWASSPEANLADRRINGLDELVDIITS